MGFKKRKTGASLRTENLSSRTAEIKDDSAAQAYADNEITPQLHAAEFGGHKKASIEKQPENAQRAACVGQGVHFKGELSSRENILIEGTVEGSITLDGCSLEVGSSGTIQAKISARDVVVKGTVVGDITAEDRIEVTDTGNVEGNIHAARVILAEGASFSGNIQMGSTLETIAAPAAAAASTATQPSKQPSTQPSTQKVKAKHQKKAKHEASHQQSTPRQTEVEATPEPQRAEEPATEKTPGGLGDLQSALFGTKE